MLHTLHHVLNRIYDQITRQIGEQVCAQRQNYANTDGLANAEDSSQPNLLFLVVNCKVEDLLVIVVKVPLRVEVLTASSFIVVSGLVDPEEVEFTGDCHGEGDQWRLDIFLDVYGCVKQLLVNFFIFFLSLLQIP